MSAAIKLSWEFPDRLDFLFEPSRYKVAFGGRGGAKSWGFARALLILGATKPMRYLCAREVQKSIKDSVHKLLSDQIEALGLSSHYQVLQTEIRGKNGTEFVFSGLSDQTKDSLKSYEGVDVCWVEEAHKVSRKSWDVLIPTIRKEGSEIWMSLNPELDTDETYVRFIENPPASARVVEVNWSDNPWFPAVLEEERQEFLRQVKIGLRTQDDYDNIWEGKCKAAVDGAIYFREVTIAKQQGRLTRVPHDPLLKVHTIWDLGWNDKMSILMVQRLGSEIRVIDYIEDSHRTIADYVQSTEGREDLASRKYRWGTDFLPHDGRHKDYRSGKSAEEILTTLGRKVDFTPSVSVEDGIKAARMIFPRTLFDKDKAGGLFNRLGRYRRRVNAQTNEEGAPLHDENSHGADGFRYLALCEAMLSNDDVSTVDPYKAFRRYG